MNKEVRTYIENSLEDHQEILIRLRKLIFAVAPESEEQYKWSRPVYALEKDFCYLQSTKKHVTFGFMNFDKIVTNKQLIEGTGKSMRHVKLHTVKDIKDIKVENMIREVLS